MEVDKLSFFWQHDVLWHIGVFLPCIHVSPSNSSGSRRSFFLNSRIKTAAKFLPMMLLFIVNEYIKLILYLPWFLSGYIVTFWVVSHRRWVHGRKHLEIVILVMSCEFSLYDILRWDGFSDKRAFYLYALIFLEYEFISLHRKSWKETK